MITFAEKLVLTAAAAAGAAAVVNAVVRPESQLFGHTIVAGRDTNEVALTYDDGPNEACTYALLDVLARHNARASFFMIGKYLRTHADMVRAVQAGGHLIGNHTMTHPWLAWKSAAFIREELRGCSDRLEDILGAPVHYFRPPHGARRPFVMRAAQELGMQTVQWNVMGFDWNPIGVDRVVANVDDGLRRASSRKRGANILLHDGSDVSMGADRSATVAATDRLLQRFAAEGQRVVTVDAWT
jgi:peptidoglycan/xylan/chitin deacetylase (PgdA/CDA1 family)